MNRSTPASIALALILTLSPPASAQILSSGAPALAQDVSQEEARAIAKDAYVYAYALSLNDLTWRQFSNFEEPTGKLAQAPLNQFSHGKEFTPAEWRVIVRPNVDTLYSPAILDLGPEPIVFSVPAIDRYYVMPIESLWTDTFAVPGTRTTGRNTARSFLLVGPKWNGEAPAGLEIIRSPTRIAAIGGRTQTNGPADYENVHKIQAQYKLTPLSGWGKANYTPPKGKIDPALDMKTPPPVQIDAMTAATYFARFAELLKDNPPGPLDYPIMHRLERVGFRPGQSFDLNTLPVALKQAFERGAVDGNAAVVAAGRSAGGERGKGWTYTFRAGAYGVDYLYRAAIAWCCLGENLPEDAVYPALGADSEGRPLDGAFNYILHFDAGKLPPVNAFWSVTAYDTEGYMIPNALKRQALGDRDPLATNADGSVDLYIQASAPGGAKDANWLPVARAPFTLLMRLYSSKPEFLEGRWVPPLVKRVN